jgi:hypothetical protein
MNTDNQANYPMRNGPDGQVAENEMPAIDPNLLSPPETI